MHDQLASMAAQYYVSARFAAKAGYVPVCGNLMHHAIELLLKGGFVKAGGVPAGQDVDGYLRKHFGHRLRELWGAFKGQHSSGELSRFDSVIAELDDWEQIRYPSGGGYAIHVEALAQHRDNATPTPTLPAGMTWYRMNIGLCDEFFRDLWSLISLNPEWFKTIVRTGQEPAVSSYEDDNHFIIYA